MLCAWPIHIYKHTLCILASHCKCTHINVPVPRAQDAHMPCARRINIFIK